MIKSNENQFSVILICRFLSVSRSFYNTYRQRPLSERQEANRFFAIEINRVFDDETGQLGASKIARRLHDQGKITGLQGVARIMHNKGWWAKRPGNTRRPTTNSHLLKFRECAEPGSGSAWILVASSHIETAYYRACCLRRENAIGRCRWRKVIAVTILYIPLLGNYGMCRDILIKILYAAKWLKPHKCWLGAIN